MKKVMWVWITAAAFLAGCDDDDNSSNNNNSEKKISVENTANSGQWRITYFSEDDTEETNNFSNYVFEFGDSNILTASNGSENVVGTWSVTSDDNSNDDNSGVFDDIDFNVSFSSPPDFQELSEDWEIVSLSDTKIELQHISGGDGSTDLLTFEKI
jgi:hypothetical protein